MRVRLDAGMVLANRDLPFVEGDIVEAREGQNVPDGRLGTDAGGEESPRFHFPGDGAGRRVSQTGQEMDRCDWPETENPGKASNLPSDKQESEFRFSRCFVNGELNDGPRRTGFGPDTP